MAMAELAAFVLLAAAFVWRVTRTNLFHHWRRHWRHHSADPGGLVHGASQGRRWEGEGTPPGSFHVSGGAPRGPHHRL
jgi:hypothetical protein